MSKLKILILLCRQPNSGAVKIGESDGHADPGFHSSNIIQKESGATEMTLSADAKKTVK